MSEKKLRIDTREKDERVIDNVYRVAEEMDVEVVEEHMETGDYVYGDCAIEFKNISDAVNSSIGDSPRLIEQGNRLAEEFDWAAVAVVGTVDQVNTHHRQISYGQMHNQVEETLSQLVSYMNMPVFWMETPSKFAGVVIRGMITREDEGEKGQMLMISPGAAEDVRMSMLMGVTRLGRGDAKKLLDKFGSVINVAHARPDEVENIPGFGSKKARRVYNAFHTEWDGEPGMKADHTDGFPWEFLTLHGVGDSILYDVFGGTMGLEEDVETYLDDEYPDMSDNKRQKIIDAANGE